MESFLNHKYHTKFLIKETHYNYLSETYQSYAYPISNPSLLFFVQEDQDSPMKYSDTYPKVFWESNQSVNMKAMIKHLFPNLEQSTFKAMQIVERGEYYSSNIPTYKNISASELACSVTINIPSNWEKLNQINEHKKVNELSRYLKTIHFPVLIEIRYYDNEKIVKVFYITEDGRIINS
jgi:hypothetical protein